MEALSVIGMIVLIVIGLLIITLLAYALRILILIYSFFGSGGKKEVVEEGKTGTLGKFIKSASVIEIILFLLKSRGRFRR